MLRVTTAQQYNVAIDNMQRSNVKIDNLSQQISSGKRVLQPSDDPIAAAQIIKLDRELAQYEKYELNIQVTERRLTLEESVLGSMRTSLNRINEFVIQGSTATLTDSDRASIAVALRTEVEYMADLMNTQDVQGEYIFAGSKGGTQPYQLQADGSYDYQGDDGQRSIKVSNELYVPSNDSGQYLFEAVAADLQTVVKGVYASEDPLSVPTPIPVVSATSFEDQAAQDKFTEATRDLGDLTITVDDSVLPLTYSVTDSNGNPVEDENGVPMTSIAFVDGDEVELLGMDVTLVAPTGTYTGNNINVLHTQPEQKNILDIVQNYASALEVPLTSQAKRDEFEAATVKMFGQWEQASERNIESVTRLGTRLSFLERVESSNADFTLFAETSLSALQDTDMATAISEYQLEEVTLQASQALFGRIAALSLFDHI